MGAPSRAILCRTALWRNKVGNFFPDGFDLRGQDTISHTPSQQKWRLDCDAGRLPSSDEMRKEDVCIFCRQGVENRNMRRDDIAVLGKWRSRMDCAQSCTDFSSSRVRIRGASCFSDRN